MITARINAIDVSPEETKIFAKFCEDHNISTDGPVGEQNILELGNYLIDVWKVQITPETMEIALQQLAGRITYLTPTQAKYKKVAAEDVSRANQLNHWFQTFNKTLVKSGDENWENQAALLEELRGREINSPNIYAAIGRISATRGGLHYVPTPRKIDPRQHKDSAPFMPKASDRSVVGGRRNHAFSEPTKQAPKVNITDSWQQLSLQILNGGHYSHSQMAQMQALYDAGATSGYSKAYAEMSKLRSVFQRVTSPRGV